MHTHKGRELICDRCSMLVLSASTIYDSQCNSISTKTSCRFYHAESGDNNFNQDSHYEFTEDFDYNIDSSANKLLANITNRERPNYNSYLPPECCNLSNPDTKELWKQLPNDIWHVLLKGRNSVPTSNINSGNRFNKIKSNKHKPVRPLSWKGKPFTRASLYEILSDLLVDDNEHEDYDAGIEDVI